MEQLSDDEIQLLKYFKRLYKMLGQENINISEINNLIEFLLKMKKNLKYEYLNSLLHPEFKKVVKIPTAIPLPSCTFQIHNTINIKTNQLGNFVLLWNPFFLYGTNMKNFYGYYDGHGNKMPIFFASTLYLNNNDDLTGLEENYSFYPVDIGQDLPYIYNQYRVVSASIILRYIGRMDTVSGVLGGSIVFDKEIKPGLVCGNSPSKQYYVPRAIAKYGNIDLAVDSFYHQETNSVNGIRELYFPLDNTYEEYEGFPFSETDLVEEKNEDGSSFFRIDTKKNGFQNVIYGLGCPPNSEAFKLDVFINFEGLPNADFLNYMPVTNDYQTISSSEKKEIIKMTQNESIKPVNEVQLTQKENDVIDGLINKIGNNLPKNVLEKIV